uniref:Uncharacterized protein n=1 Tax=Trichuris muris TaxID=70415 RepID=A0A5S6QGX6_TRIMR
MWKLSDSAVEEVVPDKGAYETVFDEIRKKASVEALVWALNFSCLACLSEVDIVADEEEKPSDRSGGQTENVAEHSFKRGCLVHCGREGREPLEISLSFVVGF